MEQLTGVNALIIVWNIEERMKKLATDLVTFAGTPYAPIVQDFQASLKAACEAEWDKYLMRMRLRAEADPEFEALLDG